MDSTKADQPLLFRAGKKLTATAIADPSITIVEVGRTLGFLIAESMRPGLLSRNSTWKT